MNPAVLRIGLTGGIGAGKSTVAGRLAGLGASVLDADRIAREVVAPGSEGLEAVVAEFGPGVLAADGSLDRAGLARLVFADEQHRLRLNAILHPLIGARTAQLLARLPPGAIAVHDVPLLVENGLGAGFHLVLVVHAPVEERVGRLVVERGLTETDARARIAVQAGDEARRAAADVWLDNSGAPGELGMQVDRVWQERIRPYAENLREHRPARRPDAVTVVPPDPAWPVQAARVAARVAAAAGDACLRVDHIGSTAVAGLPAKDVIDVQLVLSDLAAADQVLDPLQEAGFARLPGDWWDTTPDGGRLAKRVHTASDPGRAVNLHLRAVDGPAWRWQLLYRDWLRAHPDGRDAYARVKQAAAGVDVQAYLDRKGPWIAQAMVRAQAWAAATGWQPVV